MTGLPPSAVRQLAASEAAPSRERDAEGACETGPQIAELHSQLLVAQASLKEKTERLDFLAAHDPLTGLLNRRELERRVDILLARGPEGQLHSLLHLDLDQFKLINDACGRCAGDQLLLQVGALLSSRLGPGDSLARLGEDEFGILLCNQPQADLKAHALRQALRELRFAWGERRMPCSASIGLASFLSRQQIPSGEIFRRADSACYLAKDLGRNQLQVYTQGNQEVQRRQAEMHWVLRVQDALVQGNLRLHAQPIVACGGAGEGRAHMELLLRLCDEQGRMVPPMEFIPAAERFGLMPALDRWVLDSACAHYARMHGRDESGPVYAINISGPTFCDPGFLPFVRACFATHGLRPRAICFEITETAAIASLEQAARVMQELKDLGCQFALDDFGSGLSSFAYLKSLPVDFLKIDGAFVRDIAHDPVDRAIVECINKMAHELGKRTIAEFVESQDIRAILESLGVDFVQGYAVAPPAPLIPPRVS